MTAAELKVSAEKGLCVYIVPDTSAERADNFYSIAKNFVPTRERIRQIEAKALRRLNWPLNANVSTFTHLSNHLSKTDCLIVDYGFSSPTQKPRLNIKNLN